MRPGPDMRPGLPSGLPARTAGGTGRWAAWPALPGPAEARLTGAAALRGLTLRPVAGAQVPAIAAMWQRCTPATRLARFHAPVKDIPASYLHTVLADPAASVLAACGHVGDVVALASLICGPGGGTAELGVLVEDAWQRRGIGRRLVTHLITTAPARGITTLTASVRTENAKIAELLRRVPGEFSLTMDGRVLEARVRLAS
jgi:GNAT superfamily N-acetyltransferase